MCPYASLRKTFPPPMRRNSKKPRSYTPSTLSTRRSGSSLNEGKRTRPSSKKKKKGRGGGVTKAAALLLVLLSDGHCQDYTDREREARLSDEESLRGLHALTEVWCLSVGNRRRRKREEEEKF